MTSTKGLEAMHTPIAVELVDGSFDAYLKSTKHWIDHTSMLQTAFREQAEDVLLKIQDGNVRDLLGRIVESARKHESLAAELQSIVGADLARWPKPAGTFTARMRAALADVLGTEAGAAAPWRDLQQLFLGSLTAMSAFGAAEQLGYALGLHRLAELCFDVVAEKHRDHLVLQELTLEFAPWGVLYKAQI